MALCQEVSPTARSRATLSHPAVTRAAGRDGARRSRGPFTSRGRPLRDAGEKVPASSRPAGDRQGTGPSDLAGTKVRGRTRGWGKRRSRCTWCVRVFRVILFTVPKSLRLIKIQIEDLSVFPRSASGRLARL